MPYYDPYSGQEVETEEERKRREELANTAVHTTETKTYGDGTVEQITKKEIAPEQQVAAPVDTRALGVAQSMAPKPMPQQQAARPVAPTFNQQAYNASIGAQESGNRPNIQYHNPQLSSAYGQYGLTNAAYQDARRANPNLPADIKQATPEQQTQAMNAFTQQNARALQGYGIEANPNTLSAAHFAGARGLNDFMTKKDEQGRPYISPQAQAANGGYDKAAAIINQRLGGQAAPASGALQQAPQPQPQQPVAPEEQQQRLPGVDYGLATGGGAPGLRMPGQAPGAPAPQPDVTTQAIDAFQNVQNDPNGLMKLALDENTPEHIRERSREQFARVYDQQKKEAQAQKELAQLGPREVADAIQGRSKSGVGDWLQYLLLKHVGLSDLANQKGEELGIGHKWDQAFITNELGQEVPVQIQTSASGKIIRGAHAGTGEELTPQQLQQASGQILNASNMKTLQTQAHQSAASEMDAMRKENLKARNSNLPLPYSEDQILQRGREVLRQTMSINRPNTGGAPVTGLQGPGAGAPAGAATTTTTPTKAGGVLENWEAKRPGEDMTAYAKRQQIRPADVESAARQLAEGRVKPSDLGYKPEFRNLAVQRAEEISGQTYSPTRVGQVDAIVKRYTSGKDHETLVNIGTAANHLIAFREAAMSVPESQRTDVSAWNTFAQKYAKFGNAPEVKNKETMAEFVAGEMVKAATGGHGGVAERLGLEKKLLAANTPAEWNTVINGQLELAHGRYSELKDSYQRTTNRKDFDETIGIGGDAAKEFGKIEASKTINKQGSAAEKWARANPNDPRSKDILTRLGKQ